MIDLTERQRAVLRYVKKFIVENGYPPTTYEIAQAFGFASPNAAYEHLRAIKRKGFISIKPNISRGIKVLS